MNKKFKQKKRGISLIGLVVLVFIIILVLSYFGINIKAVIESPNTQDNINYVKGSGETVWNSYLKRPVAYLWNDVFIDIFWKAFINNMKNIRDNKPTDFQTAAPVVPISINPN